MATIEAIDAWASEQLNAFASAADEYLEGRGPFPDRMAVNALSGRLMVDFFAATQQWAHWARTFVAGWTEDPSRVRIDVDEFVDIVRPARSGTP